jgi:glycosyltransferase involved in cell wall biosynthesis
MKVLFLTNIPTPYRVDFFNELGKYCDLTVLYERNNASNRDEKWKSQDAEYFKEIYLNGKSIGDDSAICFSVIKFLNPDKFDLIIIGGYSTPTGMLAITYLKAKKIPFVLNSDGGIIKNDSRFKKKIKQFFIGSALAWLSTGLNTTEYLLNYGAKKENIYIYPFTSIKKIDVLTNIISIDERNILKNKLGMKEEKIVISVGQFIYRKGFDILINACKNIDNNVGIYIIGGNPTEEYMELINSLTLKNINFVGFKTKDELKDFYLAADLFVFPTREDIWGLVINEAMANGLPIVTTNKCVAGLELIKNNENGFIVNSEDQNQLSEKTNLILNNDSLKKDMSIKSLNIIREYTIEIMAKKHFDIFKKVTQRL